MVCTLRCASNVEKESEPELLEELKTFLSNLSAEEQKKFCNETDDRGNTAIHHAVKAGNLELCKELHKNGASMNARGQHNMNPLQFAARYADGKRPNDVWECMKWIMDNLKQENEDIAFNVREKDKYNFSLLHHALHNTNREQCLTVVEKLLETKHFGVTDTDKQGNTSLHLAAEFDKEEGHKILDIFLTKGKTSTEDVQECVQTKNKQGRTPLHVACSVGNPVSVRQLLKAAKDVPSIINKPDTEEKCPLHLAIQSGNLEVVKILKQHDAQVPETAIHCAVRYV